MKSFFFSAIFLLTFGTWAQPDFDWGLGIGGTNSEEGLGITVDNLNNVITVGRFRGTVDFDPGVGTENLTSLGSYDLFVQKLDADGNLLWAHRIGSTGNDAGQSVSVDASGNIYISGAFTGTVDFDPGAETANLTSSGVDAFILKLDADGNHE